MSMRNPDLSSAAASSRSIGRGSTKADKSSSSMKFYTIDQVADFVEVSPRTVRRWIEKGLLVAHRINGLVRISDADFQAFLTAHRDR